MSGAASGDEAMSDAAIDKTLPGISPEAFDSIESLRAAGFDGFSPVGDLSGSRCAEVPVARGVFLVVREPALPPRIMPSSAAGLYRGKRPSEKVEMLTEKWVPGAIVLYVGLAAGTGVRGQLQQRIKRSIRFGGGANIAAAGGRYIWQLADHRKLLFAWLPSEEPEALEARWLAAFMQRYGVTPFANMSEEPPVAEETDQE